jgi:predicted outer membrane repeat protein
MKKLRFILSIAILIFPLVFHTDQSAAALTSRIFPDTTIGFNNQVAADLVCTTGPISVMNANDSGAGSLRQAIIDICAGGTINFNSSLSGQTITLVSTLVLNKDLTIDGSSLTTRIALSGNNTVQVVQVNSNVAITIKSLVIQNGKAVENGGGIYVNTGATLVVFDSLFLANNAVENPYLVGVGEGGAIYSLGNLTIDRGTFSGNSASRGGAVSCSGGTSKTLTVIDSSYISNHALSDSLGNGGDAGAIFENCNLIITASTFSGNTAAHSGGAVLTDNDVNPTQVTNSTFYANAANSGGGIANFGGLIVKNSTFSNNNSSNGGAVRNGIGGVLSLRNSILANSVGGVDCIKSDGAPDIENISNLIESTAAAFESCGVSLLTSDPLLGPLADNGGFTQTMALLSGSPAIDAGNDGNCPGADQRGVTRPQGSQCDMGAYEWQPSSTVLVNSILPTSRSVQVGSTATVFNSIVNGGGETAYGVTLSMANAPAGSFSYLQTNCATNAIVGGMNPSLTIPVGQARCYVLLFTPSSPFAFTDVHIRAQASNAPATSQLSGINTWGLRSTSSVGPDMIALTTTTDFHQVSCNGTKPFAVAMSNVGAATGQVTVTADTGSASLPVTALIQESDPATGAIVGDHILENVGAGENLTVVVWVTFHGCVSFDPAANRIFIRLTDEGNQLIGSTSTAVSTNR